MGLDIGMAEQLFSAEEIFLSHSRTDKDTAEVLCSRLIAAGFTVILL